jgi:allantoin racemase
VKLCWIHPTTKNAALEALWQKLDDVVRPALNDGTTVEHRFLTRSTNFTRSLYAEHLNSVHMMDAAISAEADGFDGVYFGCWNDALWETREILNIPVGSVGEQSILATLPMGKRFAVVTVSEKTAAAIENDIAAYGLSSRAIVRPVRSVHPEADGDLLLRSVADPHSAMIPRFEDTALECIRDGAEVILVGCAYYGPLLRSAGYVEVADTGVPVVDSTTVSLKYLEAMVEISLKLGLVKSTRQVLRPPAPEMIAKARASLNLI